MGLSAECSGLDTTAMHVTMWVFGIVASSSEVGHFCLGGGVGPMAAKFTANHILRIRSRLQSQAEPFS